MRLRNFLPAGGLIALILFMGFYNLGGNLMNDDEGTYLYASWRVSLGEVPYRDFFISQTPLSFYAGAALFKLFTPGVWCARAASLLLIMGTGILIYRASRRFFQFSQNLSLAMAGVFLLTKHVYFLGRMFMPDCYMLFFGAAALFFALKTETPTSKKGQSIPLALIGMFSGLAALSKLNGLLVFAGYLIYLIYLLSGGNDGPREVFRKILVSSAGFLISFGLIYVLMLIFVPGTYHSTLGFHLAKEKIAASALILLPFLRIGQFIGNHNYGLIPVALIGILFGQVFKDKKRALLLFVAVASLLPVLVPGNFYPRYIVFALVPLTFFFGEGIKILRSQKKLRLLTFPVVLVLVLLSIGPTFNLKKLAAYDKGTRALVTYVNEQTEEGDYVFGDDPGINFYAQKPCPPRLVDVSGAMTRSGQITAADIQSECDRLSVKLILVEKGQSAHHLKNLLDYQLFQTYLGERYEFLKTAQREFLEVDIYKRRTP
jgi:4-amino-4-deoxy-L-arabinose transferase-like glycosyltransferase